MIFRRIKAHIEKENWFAVAIDFFIVVIGILIAFQITNWSTARHDKQVYDEALERVVTELNKNIEMQGYVRGGIANELPIVQRALEDLRACRTDVDAMANIKAAMTPLNAPYVMLFETAALEQFLGNDSFLQYQSPEARKSLTELLRVASHLIAWDRVRSEKLISSAAQMPDALAYGPLAVSGPDEILDVMLSDNPLSPPLHRDVVITVPLEIACKDKVFVASFYDWEDSAFQTSINAGMIMPRLKEVLDALGRPVEAEKETTP